jgi:hypothetical protein
VPPHPPPHIPSTPRGFPKNLTFITQSGQMSLDSNVNIMLK